MDAFVVATITKGTAFCVTSLDTFTVIPLLALRNLPSQSNPRKVYDCHKYVIHKIMEKESLAKSTVDHNHNTEDLDHPLFTYIAMIAILVHNAILFIKPSTML